MPKAESIATKLLPLPPEVLAHHASALDLLLKSWEHRVSPVLLIHGPAGIGKREVAYYLSQWLLCGNRAAAGAGRPDNPVDLFSGGPPPPQAAASASPEPCGACVSCRSMAMGECIDFTEIRPEVSDTGRTGTLKIEQFRALKESQGHGAFQSGYRVILIGDADRMTPAAGNSLLKLLEEPPNGWVFLLTASDASLVLPTLVSRCQKLRLRPFPAERLARLLEPKVDAERARACAELAQGSWKRAIALSQDEAWERRAALLQFAARPADFSDKIADWAAHDAESFGFAIEQLEQITLSLIRLSLETTPVSASASVSAAISAAYDAGVKRHGSPGGARGFWLRCAAKLSSARDRLNLPLNRKLLVQETLIPWLDLS